MFVTPAYAQAAGGAGGTGDIIGMIIPFALIFVVMYFLIIRPQRNQMKQREEMLNNIRRGDTVVTGGGLIGKVTKVYDQEGEIEIQLAPDFKIRAVRSMMANVRLKGEPAANNNEAEPAKKGKQGRK